MVCGQALSHCVNFTLRDIISHWRGDLSRLVLLEDGTICSNTCIPINSTYSLGSSSVGGYAQVGKTLISDMLSIGVVVSTTITAFPNFVHGTEDFEEVSNLVYALFGDAYHKHLMILGFCFTISAY